MADPTPEPAPTPEPTPTPSPEPAPEPNPDDGKGGKDAILADLAKERDKRQTLEKTVTDMQNAHRDQMDALAKAFGLKQDEPPSAEDLATQVATERANGDDARRELAVFKSAPTLEANAAELLDSASFLRSIAGIDPNDGEKLSAAIKAAVDSNPKFKAPPAPTPTPPFPGGPRTPAPTGAGSLGEAIQNRLTSTNR